MKDQAQIVKTAEVINLTGLSKSTIERKIKTGEFPQKVRLGSSGRAVGWLKADINEWINSRKNIDQGCANPRFLRLSAVKAKCQLSRSTIYRKIALGEFPKPVSLSTTGRAVGWLEHEVTEWLRNLPRITPEPYISL